MYEVRLVSCLTKVFCDEAPKPLRFAPEGLIGEKTAFQLAYKGGERSTLVKLEIESPIRDCIRIYRVHNVPVGFASYECDDENYLRKTPGLYPDLLMMPETERLRIYPDRWEAIWLEIEADDALKAGEYPIKLTLLNDADEVLGEAETVYRQIGAMLPPQTLIHTRWFHCDGLCQYYKVEMFSEEFWRICESFMKAAAEMSVNCILTPTHTPPLDTRVGGERVTCQLVSVKKCGEEYEFSFEHLERWVRLAQSVGMRYFEIAHLFTQWGAAHAPKIVAEFDGQLRRIFGWDSEASGDAYVVFLKQYLPALKSELSRLGILENCFFHISDEPNAQHLDDYLKAKSAVMDELNGLKVIDALSDIEFYNRGVVEKPVPASDKIRPFLEAQIKGLWTYYCCGQFRDVSNAFIAMPSARTRIIGTQLYKYDIEGFLQWGFNFYNSQYSDYPVNPYLTTDGDGFSPAGDCFIVYPGADGTALPSLRAKVFAQGVYDLRALKKLEGYIGKEAVIRLMEEGIEPIEFGRFPKDEDYLFDLRHRINTLIEKHEAEAKTKP